MKRFLHVLLAFVALLTTSLSVAQTPDAAQDLGLLEKRVGTFLKAQSAGMPGKIEIVVNPIDPRTRLAACPAPEPYLLPGKRAWGKTTVGVRCTQPLRWTTYVKATVKVHGDYFVAAQPLPQGHVIAASDLHKTTGDLTALPPSTLTDPVEATGKKLAMSIPLGSPIRKEWLRSQQVIQPGQTVRLISQGTGFRITSEARAMGSATEGQMVQTKTASGQTVSGIARLGGIVDVVF